MKTASAAQGPQLSRSVLRTELKELVLQRILDGTYQPGERIVESRLMSEFGVSQAPVREMLRELEALRFLESQPNVGVRVRAISQAELAEMYPVRAALEELAGQLAAPIISAQTLLKLEAEIDAMRAAARNKDKLDQIAHDVAFHELIVAASGNQLLLDVWTMMHFEVRTLVTFQLANDNLAAIAESHLPLLEALRSHDTELTGIRMRAHINYAYSLFLGLATEN